MKLEGSKTRIFISGEEFSQCKRLLFDINKDRAEEYDHIDSIDQMQREYSYRTYSSNTALSPEEEFIGHCSNLQAWVEHKYDTRILTKDLAFPMLKKLSEKGDPIATKVFKDEIALRFSSNFLPVMTYLVAQKYFSYFTDEEAFSLIQASQFLNLFSQKDTAWYGKTDLLVYFAKRFFLNHKYRDHVLTLVSIFWKSVSVKSNLVDSDLFPYILVCLKEKLLNKEEVALHIPYADTIVRKVGKMPLYAITELRHDKEVKLLQRRVLYQVKKIYPNKDERWLAQRIRDHEEDIVISPPIDYPQYIYAVANRKYQKYKYYPEMYNESFHQIPFRHGGIDEFVIVENHYDDWRTVLFRFCDKALEMYNVKIEWDELRKSEFVYGRRCDHCGASFRTYNNMCSLSKLNKKVCKECYRRHYFQCVLCHDIVKKDAKANINDLKSVLCHRCYEELPSNLYPYIDDWNKSMIVNLSLLEVYFSREQFRELRDRMLSKFDKKNRDCVSFVIKQLGLFSVVSQFERNQDDQDSRDSELLLNRKRTVAISKGVSEVEQREEKRVGYNPPVPYNDFKDANEDLEVTSFSYDPSLIKFALRILRKKRGYSNIELKIPKGEAPLVVCSTQHEFRCLIAPRC